jgi:AcrR family transcriptional regulator
LTRASRLEPRRSRPKVRKDYHHGDLRRTLVEAAVRAIASRGVEALNLRQIAAEAGVTAGAPYHHFSNRGELLAAIAEEGFGRLAAELIAALDAATVDRSARLEALGVAYVRFAFANPGYFRVMFHGDATTAGPAPSGLRAFELLREAVEACQKAGAAPKGDPKPLVLLAWSAVHGLATLRLDGALPFEGIDAETSAAEIGRLIARMFAATGSKSLSLRR